MGDEGLLTARSTSPDNLLGPAPGLGDVALIAAWGDNKLFLI